MGSADSSEAFQHVQEDGLEHVHLGNSRAENDDGEGTASAVLRRDALEHRAAAWEAAGQADWPPVDPEEEDDYDPRKPENIRPATAEEIKEATQKLLHLQVAQLEKAIAQRSQVAHEVLAAGGADQVVKHYYIVLTDLRQNALAMLEEPEAPRTRSMTDVEAPRARSSSESSSEGLPRVVAFRSLGARRSALRNANASKFTLGMRRRHTLRITVPPDSMNEDTDGLLSPRTPKRSIANSEDDADSLECTTPIPSPKRRLSNPAGFMDVSNLLLVAPEPGSTPSYTPNVVRIAHSRKIIGDGDDAGLMAPPLAFERPCLLVATAA